MNGFVHQNPWSTEEISEGNPIDTKIIFFFIFIIEFVEKFLDKYQRIDSRVVSARITQIIFGEIF